MTYTIGQTVTVQLPTWLDDASDRQERFTGIVANTLPAEHFEFNVLVVIEGLYDDHDRRLVWREGARYVGWFAETQLDQWQAQAA